MSPRIGLDSMDEKTMSFRHRESNRAVQPVAIPTAPLRRLHYLSMTLFLRRALSDFSLHKVSLHQQTDEFCPLFPTE